MAHTLTLTRRNGFNSQLRTWFRELSEEMVRRRMFRTTYAELSKLGDRDLADLGIARSEIGRIAREAAYGENAVR